MKSAGLLLIATLAIGGCGDKVARSVAGDTLKAVIAYEAAVDRKVAAEQGFYMVQRATIQHRLLGYSGGDGSDPSARIGPEKTVYYGHMRAATDRDARLVADSLIASEAPQALGLVIDYLDRGVRDESALRVSLIERNRELTSKLLEQLETIDQQKERLKTVRERLVTLSQAPGSVDQLKLWLQLGNGLLGTLRKP
jgi:hypothetical protein